MPNINIAVRNKIAKNQDETEYICGNSDFLIDFDFDEEWDEYEAKTARFVWNSGYRDIVFMGKQCAMPVISNTNTILCGVFAGDLHTTTPALIPSRKSILCGNPAPAELPSDVFEQMQTLFNDGVKEAKASAEAAEASAKEAAALSAVWTGSAIQDPDTLTVSIRVYKNKDLCADNLYYRIQDRYGSFWSDTDAGIMRNGEAESSPISNGSEDETRCLIFDGAGKHLYCILPVENPDMTELVLTSPNGTRFKLTVDNSGALKATAL